MRRPRGLEVDGRRRAESSRLAGSQKTLRLLDCFGTEGGQRFFSGFRARGLRSALLMAGGSGVPWAWVARRGRGVSGMGLPRKLRSGFLRGVGRLEMDSGGTAGRAGVTQV